MQGLNRSQRQQVEDGSKVDEKGIVAWTAEDFAAVVRKRRDRRHRQIRFVIRRGARTDVPRRHLKLAAQLSSVASATKPIDAGDRVELPHVQVRIIQTGHLARVVEKGVAVSRIGAEAELIRDVFLAVAVVVDMDFIQNVVGEPREVRTALRVRERVVVRHEGDRVRRVGTAEDIDVRRVGGGIFGDQRRFPMRRREERRRQEQAKQK